MPKTTLVNGRSMERYGLGRAALEVFIEITECLVNARGTDRIFRDDGSHLTGIAPIFVSNMQRAGLLKKEDNSLTINNA